MSDEIESAIERLRDRISSAKTALLQCPDTLARPPGSNLSDPVQRSELEVAIETLERALQSEPGDLRYRIAAALRRIVYLQFDDDEHFQTYGRINAVLDAGKTVDAAAEIDGYPGPAALSSSLDAAMQPKDRIESQIEALDASLTKFEYVKDQVHNVGSAAEHESFERQITDLFVEETEQRIGNARQHLEEEIVDVLAVGEEVSALGRLTKRFTNTVNGMKLLISAGMKNLAVQVTKSMSTVARSTRTLLRTSLDAPKFPNETLNITASTVPPDDATRQQWELNAAIQILMGKPVPAERKPFLQSISISGFDELLFETLKASWVDLSEVYVNPEANSKARILSFDNLSSVAELTELKHLNCSNSLVEDLWQIQNTTSLEKINCSRTHIVDLRPLKNLKKLHTLHCWQSKIQNLNPISELSNLESLSCHGTNISELDPIANLNNLEELFCSNTAITSVYPLRNLSNLRHVYIHDTNVSDLSPLKHLRYLTSVYCRRTLVEDWSPVDHIENVFGRPKDWVRKPKRD